MSQERLQKIRAWFLRALKHRWAALVVIGVCVLIWCVLQGYRARSVSKLQDMNGATRFAPEGGYAQISCYFSESEAVATERRAEFAYRIEQALTENAIEVTSDNPSARLFIDCYTVDGRVVLTRGKKTAAVDAIGTGGDFFYLHPVELVSGMYYSPDALTQDQILIDEGLAWQFFGSFDVAGQTLDIGGTPHVVRGVVKTGEGRMREAAGSAEQLVYMPASSLIAYGTLRAGVERMNTYEVVMPNPVRDFAATIIREKLGFDETQMVTIDAATRFQNLALLKVLRAFGTRSMTSMAMRYPYWENIARGTEDILAIVMMLQAIVVAIPVALIVYEIVYLYRHRKWTAYGLFTSTGDRIYEIQAQKMRQSGGQKK